MADWMDVAIDAGLKLAERAVNKVFSHQKKPDADPILMSLGLAVGYYYNFLEPFAQQLSSGEIEFTDQPNPQRGGGGAANFTLDDANIQIILPERLDGAAFQRCEAEFNQGQKGSVYLNAQKRYYGVNYRTFEANGVKKLTIIDYARPASAAKRYYEDVVRMDTSSDGGDARWRELQKARRLSARPVLEGIMEQAGGGTLTIRDGERRVQVFVEQGEILSLGLSRGVNAVSSTDVMAVTAAIRIARMACLLLLDERAPGGLAHVA